MGTQVLHEAYRAGVKKHITLIGGCSYPADAPSPIKETTLLQGYPQVESASYALAKAMSYVQGEAYRRQYGFNSVVLVPGNMYGPHDNFDLRYSHVIPALIRKFFEAKVTGVSHVVAWGTGKPVRDFIYVEDACKAIVIAAERYDASDLINISSGMPTSIRELTELIAGIVGFRGEIIWDTTKPDGQMVKIFDNERMKSILGYQPTTSLRAGLENTVCWFEKNYDSIVKGYR
jgi:GDP-L-fucose synthase